LRVRERGKDIETDKRERERERDSPKKERGKPERRTTNEQESIRTKERKNKRTEEHNNESYTYRRRSLEPSRGREGELEGTGGGRGSLSALIDGESNPTSPPKFDSYTQQPVYTERSNRNKRMRRWDRLDTTQQRHMHNRSTVCITPYTFTHTHTHTHTHTYTHTHIRT
jgi:hypothetical protein